MRFILYVWLPLIVNLVFRLPDLTNGCPLQREYQFDLVLVLFFQLFLNKTVALAGRYQDNPGQSLCKACLAGKYCDPYEDGVNATGIVAPVDCPPGYYCPTATAFSTQNPCSPGTFSNATQLTAQGEWKEIRRGEGWGGFA